MSQAQSARRFRLPLNACEIALSSPRFFVDDATLLSRDPGRLVLPAAAPAPVAA